MKTSFKKIPLNKIIPHPKLTPEFINSDGIRPDKEILTKHKKVFDETSYREPLKVIRVKGRFYLLADYELWESYQDALSDNLGQKIDVIVIPFNKIEDAVELAAYLSIFKHEKKGYHRRLFDIQVLEDAGKTKKEIRQILDISGSKTAKEKQFERDYRLYSMKPLLSRTLGIEGTGSILDLIKSKKSINADFTASQADQILTKLKNDPDKVQQFLERFDIYKENLKRNHISKDEVTKPVHEWKSYDFRKVLHLAINISLSNKDAPLANNKSREDQRYTPVVDNDLGIIKILEITFSTITKDIIHGKRMVEVVYFMMQAYHTLLAHIRRVMPTKHGGQWKTEEMKSNNIKLDDKGYLDFIRKYRLLYYVNRERLLKSIHLHPGLFGFDSSSPDALSSFEKAQKQYSYWWEYEFLRRVEMSEEGKPEKHHLFTVYNLIKTYLESMKSSSIALSLEDFISALFIYVLGKLDTLDAINAERIKRLEEYDRNSIGKTDSQIDDILGRDGSINLSRQQLDSYLYQHNQTLSKEISELRSELHLFKNLQTDSKTESIIETLRGFEAEYADVHKS